MPSFYKEISDINPDLINLYATECTMTLFSGFFPFNDLLRIWDCVLYFKYPFIIVLQLQILGSYQDQYKRFDTFDSIKNFTFSLGFDQVSQYQFPFTYTFKSIR